MSQKNSPFVLPIVKESQVVFEESLLKVKRDRLQVGSNPSYDYYSLVTYPFAVAILATTPDGSLVLTQEYRHPTAQILLGCPGGFVDLNEDPIESAKRELMEETGFQAQSFQVIGSAFPYAGISSQKTIYIQAQEAVLIEEQKLESSEIIRPLLIKLKDILQAISQRYHVDGNLCTALFFYQLHNSI